METIRFLNFKVVCPRSPYHQEEPMQLKYIEKDGNRIYAPCNGCDNMDGSIICKKCRIAVFGKFNRGFLPERTGPVWLSPEELG